MSQISGYTWFALGATFTGVLLKLAGETSWPWWTVLAPLYGTVVPAVLLHVAAFTVALYRHWRHP